MESVSENQLLDVLSDTITDVGFWTWWMCELPSLILIEFDGTQLYFPSSDNTEPPSSQIAIQFINPQTISFLSVPDNDSELEENWYDLLHEDKFDPPVWVCTKHLFTFTDNQLMKSIINGADKIITTFGYSPKLEKFLNEKYKLVFMAGNVGFAVAANGISLLSKNGEFNINDIEAINDEWWNYWEKYWKLSGTENELPKDYACEVTIPAGKL
jgi:hypothetical protein